jgi:hypothetical protein
VNTSDSMCHFEAQPENRLRRVEKHLDVASLYRATEVDRVGSRVSTAEQFLTLASLGESE